jgi:hypothetical protein
MQIDRRHDFRHVETARGEDALSRDMLIYGVVRTDNSLNT